MRKAGFDLVVENTESKLDSSGESSVDCSGVVDIRVVEL